MRRKKFKQAMLHCLEARLMHMCNVCGAELDVDVGVGCYCQDSYAFSHWVTYRDDVFEMGMSLYWRAWMFISL